MSTARDGGPYAVSPSRALVSATVGLIVVGDYEIGILVCVGAVNRGANGNIVLTECKNGQAKGCKCRKHQARELDQDAGI